MLATELKSNTIIPSLEVIHTGKQLKRVKFLLSTKDNDLKFELGKAYANIVNDAWVSSSVSEYVDSLLQQLIPKNTKETSELKILQFNLLRQLSDILSRSNNFPEINGTLAILQSIRIDKEFQNKGLFKPY